MQTLDHGRFVLIFKVIRNIFLSVVTYKRGHALRGGFRHVQHVRPNRGPTKRGPHKRTGKFLQHSILQNIQ